MKNVKKLFTILLLLVVTVSLSACGKKKESEKPKEENNKPNVQINKNITIIDPNSNSRTIAVMINNHRDARPYQSGLQDAYITYEMLVEGGITRYLALFRDKNTTMIGPVRSSRPYYLDYVLENNAVYTHFGGSDEALKQIPQLGINNVNGMSHGGFWRESLPVAYEHTAFTNIENIKNNMTNFGYASTTDTKVLLSYSADEINLDKSEGTIVANNVVIPYSYDTTTSYKYDSENKVYNRYVNDAPHVEYTTGKQLAYKNIIVAKINYQTLAGYGYQQMNNIGSGDGYYITNGYAVPIKWSKASRNSQTTYTYLNGEEIKVNDGNTFIQNAPDYFDTTIN